MNDIWIIAGGISGSTIIALITAWVAINSKVSKLQAKQDASDERIRHQDVLIEKLEDKLEKKVDNIETKIDNKLDGIYTQINEMSTLLTEVKTELKHLNKTDGK